ncbi:MAG: aminotransferase class V-fold PLP-dependent enzyme [Lentisphaerae bacterium]|jgi:perosamine synthetase|nr:aminotransferase class V-fold PLP-dependent enzyme [Lentisphaerota bacterium]MBT4822582.1 aminotransferase class V-fold PLP-dependent enzyme [Lentisphaerota bacterium]MBT5608439.1 aminotransferase class V-fold PLP-dependent enzyme [Lentisphaerota bacterium]MBT7055161.1 aminotransferase class V-fold PLP-dependent enzyme [Lentisphaerota bacterium]MBT7841307.1 aminotransferase class V-fold PLP-dependent enzyme [Lentisphaerota bacterium]
MAEKREQATYGAAAFAGMTGSLPTQWPRTIGPNAMKYLQEVVDSGLQSDMSSRFERAFAEACGVKHCIGTPGCTPALAMLAAAFAFEPGDEIIVSPVTDYGTIQGLVRENYIPVFADTASSTVNLSAETIEPCITDRTRAILVVHKTGLVCDMDPINALAEKHGLIVYEDACQAVFSEYKGRFAGTLGKAAGFSFDSEKTLGSDVGGCVVTDDDELAERIRFVGHSRGGEMAPGFGRIHTMPGYAFRMPHCTAAICLAQLEIIRDQVAHRDRMIRLLSQLIGEVPGVTPLPIPDYMTVYSAWMFGMNLDPAQFTCTTEQFARDLAETGIPGAGTGRYYLIPAACTFLEQNARAGVYPYSQPPASRSYSYVGACPRAETFLQTWIRWSTFCARYEEEHCELAAHIVRRVADKHRR